MTLEEYLSLSFPDSATEPEFVRDHLEERPVPGSCHSEIQSSLIVLVSKCAEKAGRKAFSRPELRVKTGPASVRVPDLLIYLDAPPPRTDRIIEQTPAVAIEIVSPGDPLERILDRLGEYFDWGVAYVYLIEARFRQMYRYTRRGLELVDAIEIPEIQLSATLEDILPVNNA